MLSDGSSREVDEGRLRDAARELPTISDDDQIGVRVGDRLVGAIALMRETLDVEPDLLLRRSTLNVLRELGFNLEGAGRYLDDPAEDRNEVAERYIEIAQGSDDSPPPPLVPERSTSLQRLAGEWAALRGGKLVDHDRSLAALTDRNRRWETVYARIPDKRARKA